MSNVQQGASLRMAQRAQHESAKASCKDTPPAIVPQPLALSLLFSVQFEHEFYNLNGGACPDFQVVPAPASARFMAAAGLIFRDTGSGFSVYCPPSKLDALRQAVQQQAGTSPGCARLSFALLLTNPNFPSLTALPLTLGLAPKAIYATNLTAHASGGKTILCAGDLVAASALYPVVGQTFLAAVPGAAASVNITDVFGTVIAVAAAEAGVASVTLPEGAFGYYTMLPVAADGDAVVAVGFPKSVLYLPPGRGVTGWLDIMMAQPSVGVAGIYPLPPQGHVGAVSYTLPFPTRPAFWLYYIIPQDPSTRLTNLVIQQMPTPLARPQAVTFALQPDQKPLPNGAMASLFISQQPVAQQQCSSLRFQLSGTKLDADSLPSPVQVSPLPLAAAAPVWPSATPDVGLSEIYVYV